MPQLLGPFDLFKKVAAEVDLPQFFFSSCRNFFFFGFFFLGKCQKLIIFYLLNANLGLTASSSGVHIVHLNWECVTGDHRKLPKAVTASHPLITIFAPNDVVLPPRPPQV
jgi:hypothetical protein